MRIGIFADVHIHPYARFSGTDPHSGLNFRVVESLTVLREVLSIAKREQLDRLICAGDLFHRGVRVETAVFNSVARCLEATSCPITLVAGNHDYADREGKESLIYALQGFVDETAIEVRSRGNILLVAYTEDRDALQVEISNFIASTYPRPKILIGHLAVEGAVHGRFEFQPPSEIKIGVFKDFDFVFLGHYHKRQWLASNVMYVGSLVSLDFSDSGETKGLTIFDTETREVSFVPIESTGFLVLDMDKDIEEQLVCFPDKRIVRVDYTGELDEEGLRRNLYKRGAVKVVFQRKTPPKTKIRVELDSGKEPQRDDYLEAYVRDRRGELDATRLLTLGKEIVHTVSGSDR